MTITQRILFGGGAFVLAVALGQCNSTPPATVDLGSTADLATPPGAPTLTAVSPSNAANNGGVPLTLTGTNFLPGATVTIGGTAATSVVVVSSTQITCVVPAKAATCGAQAVQVTNPNNSAATRADLFSYRPSVFGFAPVASLTMGTNTRQVIAADVNNDTKLDLISANSGSANVSVRLGNGDGTFGNTSLVVIGVGTSPYAVAAADVNGDGKLDLLTANNNGNSVSVRIGVGDGTFTTPASGTFAVGAGPYDLAVGDLNGDQKLDVVAVNNGSSNVSVLLGNGDGTFQGQTTTAVSGTQPTAIILADFNADQKLDFATADQNGNNATVRLGNGNGGFGLGSTPMGVMAPMDLVAGDFNADKKLDLAIANSGVGTVRIALGAGDGTFINGATPAVSTGVSNRSIAAGDFNLDGNLDLAVTNVATSNVSILLGNGDGTFATQQTFAMGAQPSHISVADVNRDGLLDLLTTDQGAGAAVVRLSQCQ